MKTRYLLAASFATLAFFGCSDDSAIRQTCNSNEDCAPDKCVKGYCVPADSPEAQDPPECSKDEDCEEKDADHKTCLYNGKCGKYYDDAGECSISENDDALCHESYVCYGVCMKLLSENESCDYTKPEICDSSKRLECVEGTCQQTYNFLQKGEACNDSNLKCAIGLSCFAQDERAPEITKCTELVSEDQECNETKNVFCKDKLYCKKIIVNEETGDSKHICTPLGVTCADDIDCIEGDSRCCTDPAQCTSIELNHCIPYDNSYTHTDSCFFETKPGIFESQIQCRWQPTEETAASNVELTPLVGKFHNKKNLETVVAFWSYSPTVLRFMNPETCETLESIKYELQPRWNNNPAAADLDGDGYLEIVLLNKSAFPIAFKWNETTQKHEVYWTSTKNGGYFVLIFDVNQDGKPEVVVGDGVFNGQTGDVIFAPTKAYGYLSEPSLGYFDNKAMLILDGKIQLWNNEKNKWDLLVTIPQTNSHTAYADFGTPGKTAEDFDYNKFDGIPEFVVGGGNTGSGAGKLHLYALAKKSDGSGYDVQELMNLTGYKQGGPITIGDFNSDGLPEIGVASNGAFGVYDPKCKQYEPGGCADKNVLWERWSQDNSSGATGSTLFDFDGDGQAEAVYGDECFTRVYDGKTGKILFSTKRSSGTANEAPVVADIDGDGSAEIIMGSASEMSCTNDTNTKNKPAANSTNAYDFVDPIHEGIKCIDDEDCPTAAVGSCDQLLGYCLCHSDSDCNTQYLNGKILQQYVCAPPIHPDTGFFRNTDGSGRKLVKGIGSKPDNYPAKDGYKVCRATRITNQAGVSDLMVYKDRLDRWVSSRKLWNQHAYNIININDDGSVTSAVQWLARFTENILVELEGGATTTRRKYNNYRLNAQGEFGANTAPDITGRFIAGSICGVKKDENGNPILDKDGKEIHIISGNLCNRGTKPVGSKLPATFFFFDETVSTNLGEKICTSYTDFVVGVGECYQVGCEVTDEQYNQLVGKKVIMVSNLNEFGLQHTVECNSSNNTSTIEIEACDSGIKIDN